MTDSAREELREEISALLEAVRMANARLEAISDEFQDRLLDLDTLKEAVELLKHEHRRARRPPGEEQSIFDQQRFRGDGSAR